MRHSVAGTCRILAGRAAARHLAARLERQPMAGPALILVGHGQDRIAARFGGRRRQLQSSELRWLKTSAFRLVAGAAIELHWIGERLPVSSVSRPVGLVDLTERPDCLMLAVPRHARHHVQSMRESGEFELPRNRLWSRRTELGIAERAKKRVTAGGELTHRLQVRDRWRACDKFDQIARAWHAVQVASDVRTSEAELPRCS